VSGDAPSFSSAFVPADSAEVLSPLFAARRRDRAVHHPERHRRTNMN
jgi:hypothetical protein